MDNETVLIKQSIQKSTGDHFSQLVNTIAQLRDPDHGCPWDLEQTHDSLQPYLLEETYETLDAIRDNNMNHLCEELGDVLLQIILQSQIAKEEGYFTIDDVCQCINEKLIRRHPHVFKDSKAESAKDVSKIWAQVKLKEHNNSAEPSSSLLNSVPESLPALSEAQKISKKAVAVGFEWDSIDEVWDKVEEELKEFQEAFSAHDINNGQFPPSVPLSDIEKPKEKGGIVSSNYNVNVEFGDLLFSLVNVGRKLGIDAEFALRSSNKKFRDRFMKMEETARKNNKTLDEFSTAELNEIWDDIKKEEKGNA